MLLDNLGVNKETVNGLRNSLEIVNAEEDVKANSILT